MDYFRVGDEVDKIKVIFLDVDGVLNNRMTTRRTKTTGYIFVGNKHIRNLKRIINETDAKVVLSSDWRYDRDDPKQNGDFLELRDELMRRGIKFYGFTPDLRSATRGEEITLWLSEHPEVSNFVILDDRSDMEPNKDHLVQTTMIHGLGEEDADKAIRILNGKGVSNCD